MIIRNLKLRNYRRFGELNLELPENLIGIVGNNGTGKSTIVEAIGWALYGNRIKRTDKYDIRSQFCPAKEVCSVEMEFAIGGHEYRILRQLKGKTAITEAAIYRDGNPEPDALQERGVNEFIEQLLNLDYRSFFVSVFAKQKELAALSMLQPEERRKSIARLINIDTIERARRQARADRNRKEAVVQGMRAGQRDEKELKQQKRDITEKLTLQIDVEKKQQQQFKKSEEQLTKSRSDFDALGKLRDQYSNMKSQLEKWQQRQTDYDKRKLQQQEQLDFIHNAKSELEKISLELAEYEQIKTEKERLDQERSKAAALNAKTAERDRLSKLITGKTTQLKAEQQALKDLSPAADQLKNAEAEFIQFEQHLETVRTELSDIQGQKKKTEALGQEVKQRKAKVSSLGAESPCPVCTRPLAEHYEDVIKHFDGELLTLREEWKKNNNREQSCIKKRDELNSGLKTLKTTRDQLIRQQEQYQQRENSCHKLQADLKEWQASLDAISSEITDYGTVSYDEAVHNKINEKFRKLSGLRDQALKYTEHVNRLPQVNEELKQIEKILRDLKTDIAQQQDAIKKLAFDEEKYLQAKNKVDKDLALLEQDRKQLDRIQRDILILQKDIEKIDSDIEQQKQLIKDIKTLEEEMHYLAALDQHFSIFRQELSGRIRPVIARRASELLTLTTDGRYSLLELDDDYNIFLYDQTDRFPLARFSGGEQDLANLCLRIAVSQVVAERAGGTQINFIVLDEIFGSQDEERKELIMHSLQHLSSQFRQIFVITHIDEIKDVMPVVISVTEKSPGQSIAKLI